MENEEKQTTKLLVAGKKKVKSSPKTIQMNQNTKISFKSSSNRPIILQKQDNPQTYKTVMLKIPNAVDTTKSNLSTSSTENLKEKNGNNNAKIEKKSITLNSEQLKNLFNGSINSCNSANGSLNTPIVLSMNQLKNVLINPKSVKVLRTNPNSSQEKFLLPKASSQEIKTYSRSIKSINSNLTETSNEDISNISMSNSSSIVTSHIQVNKHSISKLNSINLDQEPKKIIQLNDNQQNGVKKCSPVVQTLTKNPSSHIQVNTISPSDLIKMDSRSIKNTKLNHNLQNTVEKTSAIASDLVKLYSRPIKNTQLNHNLQNGVEKNSTVALTLTKNKIAHIQEDIPTISSQNSINIQNGVEKDSSNIQTAVKNKKYVISANNRFRVIEHNGKKIALPVGNLVTKFLKTTQCTNEKSLNEEITNEKPQKIVPEDKNPFVFDSMTLPVGTRKIYTRRPKTPDHIYKKFNLPVQKNNESTETTKIIEKRQEPKTNYNYVIDSVTDLAKHNEFVEKKKKIARKRTSTDFESTNGKNPPVINNSSNMLIQTLKSKFVPLVGHACTATIIEHLNLAYARCRISNAQAVRELIQYVDNFERYRDRKLQETRKQNTWKEKGTQTENSVAFQPQNVSSISNKNVIVEEQVQTVPNSTLIQDDETRKRKSIVNYLQQKSPIVPNLSDEFDMYTLQVFKDWSSATVPDVMGNMPIHNAVLENDFYAVKRLCLVLKHLKSVNIQNETYDMTALHLAISNNCDLKIIQHLLDCGVRPEVEDVNGNNCLHMISQYGNATIMELLLTKYKSHNLDLNTCNYNGSTPLMLCTEYNNVDIAELLLKHNADTEIQDLKSGRTVLFQAIEANNEPMVKLLIEYGADPKKRDYSGITPLEVISEIRISPGIRKIMYKILSQNIVNLQRKRQKLFVDNGDDDVILSPIISEKIRRINDENEDDNT